MLLPEGRVDLQMRRPKFLLGVVRRGVFEVGDRQALACSAVPARISTPLSGHMIRDDLLLEGRG
jgi:hypothetical protein